MIVQKEAVENDGALGWRFLNENHVLLLATVVMTAAPPFISVLLKPCQEIVRSAAQMFFEKG